MAEERKVEFAGNGTIKKCPNCGAQLEAFQARCPACGFAIGGEEKGGSAALKKFLDMYTNEKDNARKLEMIDTFPIPNTIEDTVEFAMLAAQQVKSFANRQKETLVDGGGDYAGFKGTFAMVFKGASESKMIKNSDLRIAWQNKLDQICHRAKIAYPQEKEKLAHLDMLVEDAKNATTELKKKNILVYILIIALFGGIWVFNAASSSNQKKLKKAETQRLEKLMTEIRADIAEGNYDEAELKLVDLTWSVTLIGGAELKEVTRNWNEKRQTLEKLIEKNKEKAGE